MKSIYQMSSKEIDQQCMEFRKTAYGQLIFWLSYGAPILGLVILFISTLLMLCGKCALWICIPYFMLLLGGCVVTFVVGSAFYYSKLEKFIDLGIKVVKRPKTKK